MDRVPRLVDGSGVPPEAEPLVWTIDAYALVESKPGNGGGYTVLQTYP